MTLKQKLKEILFINRIIIILLYLFLKLIRIVKKNIKKNNGKVVIISLHKLGDTVFTIPAINELIKNYSDKAFYIMCFGDSEIIYRQTIQNVNYEVLNKNDFYLKGRLASFKAIKKLNNISPDTIVDLTGSITSASLILTSNCKAIYGINEDLFKGIYDNYHTIRMKPHQIDIYFDALGTLIPESVKKFNGYKLNYNTSGILLIQPFAGWEAKEWGLRNFSKLYKKISSMNDCALIFPVDSINPDIVSSLEQDGIKMIFTENIERLICEIKECKLFISNDSGPLQIAALLGKPTFSIYGPTNPSFHIPFGEYHSSIKKQLKCSPENEKYCHTFGGRYCPHYDCMKLLPVGEVFDSISKMLTKLNSCSQTISKSVDDLQNA